MFSVVALWKEKTKFYWNLFCKAVLTLQFNTFDNYL